MKEGIINTLAASQKNKEILDEKISEANLNLESLSAYLRYSPQYTIKIFKKTYGMTPMRYNKIRRLHRARQIISDSDVYLGSNINLESIAYDCGFNSYSHFSRDLSAYFGMSPSQVRIPNSLNEVLSREDEQCRCG